MNKLFKLLWAMIPAMCLVLVGCDDQPDDEPLPGDKPVISLKATTVEAGAKSGEYTVNYTITNPIDGELIEVNTDANWVVNFDVASAGAIKFEVVENTVEEPREATVEVSYKYAESVNFVVKQAAARNQNLTFTVDEVDIRFFDAELDVYPNDQKIGYLYGIYAKAYIEEYDLTTDEALFNDDMDYFAWLGQFNGLTAQEVAEVRLKYGNQYSVNPEGFRPGTEYVFYLYYYDPVSGERLSDIHRHYFTTPTVELGEVEFTTTVEVEGPAAHITAAAPSDYLDAFYFDVLQKSIVDQEAQQLGLTTEEYVELWWNTLSCNQRDEGYNSDTIIYNLSCSYIEDVYDVELLAETEYYLFAFAVNEDALCSSVPQIETFTTGSVEMSENEITIIVSDVTPYGAVINFRTTVAEDTYVAGWVEKSEWDTYGATDRARLQKIMEVFQFDSTSYLKGDVRYEEKTGMTADTQYVVFAFGFYGGVATTDLYFTEFKTVSDAPSPETLSLREMGYFSISAINAIDPTFGNLSFDEQYAIYPIEVVKSDESVVPFYTVLLVNSGNRDYYTDMAILSYLINDAPTSGFPAQTYYFVEYNYENWVVAIGKDSEGRYTELYKNDFYCTREGVSDANVFVEWKNGWMGTASVAAPSSLVFNEEAVESTVTLLKRKDSSAQPVVRKGQYESKEVVPAVDAVTPARHR